MRVLALKIVGLVIVTLILLQMITPGYSLLKEYVVQPGFQIVDTMFKSRVGGPVYPGSQDASLKINVKFYGELNASRVYAHIISTPSGFNFDELVSPAYNYNGRIATTVSPGEIVYFKYAVNIDKSVQPGTYLVRLNITYIYNLTQYYHVISIEVHINNYPNLNIRLIETYWTPDGYPGEESASLHVVILNDADITIKQALVNATIQAPIEPTKLRTETGNINPYSRSDIVFSNIFIKPDAKPGKYTGIISFDAEATTNDGVTYYAKTQLVISVTIQSAPRINLKIVDYGFAGDYPGPGTRNTQLYIKIQNLDRATLKTVVVSIKLLNSRFMNGSRRGIVVVNGPIDYGDVFTIVSPRLNITFNESYVMADIDLGILSEYGGSTYWSHANYTLKFVYNRTVYDIHLLYVHWNDDKVYPNSTGHTLIIGIENLMRCRIEGAEVSLKLPSIFEPIRAYIDNIVFGQGSVTTLNFKNICVKPNARPGNYTAVLSIKGLLVDSDGSYRPVELNFTLVIPLYSPPKPIKIVDYGFAGDYPGPGTRNTQLYIKIQNLDRATMDYVIARIELVNSYFMNGSRHALLTVNEPIAYGEILTINSPKLVIPYNQTFILAIINFDILMSYNGISYWVQVKYSLVFRIRYQQYDIHILYDHWANSKVYPGSSDQIFVVGVENLMRAKLEGGEAILILPPKIFYPRQVYIDNVVLDSGSVSRLVFRGINVDRYARPGNYTAVLSIKGLLVDSDGSYRPVELNFTLVITVSGSNMSLIELVTYRWITGKAYPSMNNTGIEALLQVIRNAELRDIVATIILPKGLWAETTAGHNETITLNGPYGYGSIIPLRFTSISIDRGIMGTLYVAIKLTAQATINGANTWINKTILLKLYVEPPNNMLEIISARWGSGKAYPWTAQASIQVLTRISDDITVDRLSAKIIYPQGIVSTHTGGTYDTWYTNTPHQYGDIIPVQYTGIKIEGLSPGNYSFTIIYMGIITINGGTAYFQINKTITLEISKPVLNIKLMDASWNIPDPSHVMDNAGINILLYNNQTGTITQLTAKLLLPTSVESFEGRKYIIRTITSSITYAQVFSISFNGIRINTTNNTLPFTLVLTARIDDLGTIYLLNNTLHFKLEINSTNTTFILSRIATTYNGQPAPLLPTAKGVTLSITLLNIRSYTINSLTAEIILPRGFETIGYRKSVAGPVSPGATVTLTYRINIGDLRPGVYKALLKLFFTRTDNGAVITTEQSISVFLVIDDPKKYCAELKVMDVHWGTTAPTYVYPGMRDQPASIIIVNNGQYSAYNVRLILDAVNARPLTREIYVASTIAPGASVRAIAYFDLGNSKPGVVPLNITVQYQIRMYGADIDVTYRATGKLVITQSETMINNTEIYLVNAGWRNNWPVYPGTKNAEYTFTIANLLPYSVAGVLAKLILPSTFKPHTNYSMTTYIAGPINSLQSITGSFRLDVIGKPGVYRGFIEITYYIMSGGPGLRKTIYIPIKISISDPRMAVSVITYGWQAGQPTLDMKGARYYVVLRNNEIPQIQYPILYVRLPSGIYYSPDNSSVAKAPASAAVIPQTPSTTMTAQPGMEQIIRLLTTHTQQTTVTTTSKGALISFILPLNLCLKHPGKYMVDANLSYIDPWGSQYNLTIKFPILVLGKPAKLGITASQMIVFHNGTTWFTMTLNNTSPSPIYNVYVMLAPMAPLALPIDNVKYISVIKPGESINVTYRLVYNPMNMITYGGGTPISYASVPFKIAIIYRDPTGAMNIYNTTISSQVKPFIDIGISSDTKAKYSGGTLSVSGVLINYGITQARSVDVTLVYGNIRASNFVGDIDAASQMAFKVSANVQKLTTRTITLEITYRDMYNNLYYKTFTLPIEVENTTSLQPVSSASTSQPTLMHYLIVGMVGAFLVGVFIVIYRLARRHMRKLGG